LALVHPSRPVRIARSENGPELVRRAKTVTLVEHPPLVLARDPLPPVRLVVPQARSLFWALRLVALDALLGLCLVTMLAVALDAQQESLN
jgi:hypothetical protein